MTAPETASERSMRVIRGLLTQAEDEGATAEERETFLAKATEMMAKYGVDRAVLAATGEERDEIGATVIWAEAPYARRKLELLNNVAVALRCRTAFRRVGVRVRAQVFGFASDRERVEVLYTSLLIQQARELAVTEGPVWESARAYRSSWLHGYAVRIHFRLHAAERRAADRHQQDMASGSRPAGPSTALVLADRKQQVDDYYGQQGFRSGRRSTVTGSGAVAGRRAADRADLGGTRVGASGRRRSLN